MEKQHILICGERHAGKSTLIEKLMKELDVSVYGFFTRMFPDGDEGQYSIHIFSVTDTEQIRTDANHVGNSNGRQNKANIAGFDICGVELLEPRPGIVIMDELGVLETGSEKFCASVLEHLDSNEHVIAAVKAKNSDFLNKVRNHPKAQCYEITVENRDELYKLLLPVVRSWNEKNN